VQTSSGATILSGATIQTPDLVGATVVLGALGFLDIAPNTRLKVEFGRDGKVKVTLIEGCVVLRINKGNHGEVVNEAGVKIVSNDPARLDESALDVCLPKGAPEPIVNQGAAANAGAGAEVGGGVGGTRGLGSVFWWSLGGGTGGAGFILYLALRGDDPSQSS
jgi:hypothetical protein